MTAIVHDLPAGSKKICLELKVIGIVQGVGFRPFVYHLARENGIHGWVRNEGDGVRIVLEGAGDQIAAFCQRLIQAPPLLARIDQVEQRPGNLQGYDQFIIDLSRAETEKSAVLPPDIATCPACLDEIRQPRDRHFGYPFTNCTCCGPRFTITENLPYDRANTAMKRFPPCAACAAEYRNPADRRFHAQPVACPNCGPRITITDPHGKPVAGSGNWAAFFFEQISRGRIMAVKGLGGYHLACAAEEAAVTRFRERKKRPDKPFAVMCRDLKTAAKYCRISQCEADWLTSPAAPILLLARKPGCPLPENISPGLSTLGVMLPYTPLHHLILQGPFNILVLTSANRSGLPVIIDDGEALANLHNTADYFLTHDREIVQRCDDSVARVTGNQILFHRRARGFTPEPVKVSCSGEVTVLGAGAEMKNTFCLLKGGRAYLSQHLGEMGTVEGQRAYRDSLRHFGRSFNLQPQVVAYDPHPDYAISALAREIPAEKYYSVYHHHAHFVSCLAENGHTGDAVGAILDGTGYGADGAVWGFEILAGDSLHFTREFHQRYTPLPGGDSAARWPWRTALSYLRQAMGAEGIAAGRRLFERQFKSEFDAVGKQVETGLYAVQASSCGRLFDAAAAVLGICCQNSYEGQAAIQLGELPGPGDVSRPLDPYPYAVKGKMIDFYPLFPELLAEVIKGKNITLIARRFHDTVISAVIETVVTAAETHGLSTVALSGGTWLNSYLAQKTGRLLTNQKYKVLLHREVPPNDGGLSLGQAVSAYWRWKRDVPGNSDADTAH